MQRPEQRSRLTPHHQPKNESQESKPDYRNLGSMGEVFAVVNSLFKNRDFQVMLNMTLAKYCASLSNPDTHLRNLRDERYRLQGVLTGIGQTVRCVDSPYAADSISDLCVSVRSLGAFACLRAREELKMESLHTESPAAVIDDTQFSIKPEAQNYQNLGSMQEVMEVVNQLVVLPEFKASLVASLNNFYLILSDPNCHLNTLRDVRFIRRGVLEGICKTLVSMKSERAAEEISALTLSVIKLGSIDNLAAQAKLKQDAAAAASPEFQADVMDDSQVGSQPDPNELT